MMACAAAADIFHRGNVAALIRISLCFMPLELKGRPRQALAWPRKTS